MQVLIYDDELLFSEALSVLLRRRGHEVASCPTTLEKLFAAIEEVGADACLLKLRDADAATEFPRQLRLRVPELPIVVLVADLDMALLRRAVDAGANGLCLKLDSIDEIESVLLRAATGSPPVWSRGALSLARRHAAQPRGASLTPKEQAVLERLVRGASTERIAQSLGVGEATVRTHIQHLFTKFNVHSRLALVASAVRSDAVSVGDELRFARSG